MLFRSSAFWDPKQSRGFRFGIDRSAAKVIHKGIVSDHVGDRAGVFDQEKGPATEISGFGVVGAYVASLDTKKPA